MPSQDAVESTPNISYINYYREQGFIEIDGDEPRNGITPILFWKKIVDKDVLILAVDDDKIPESYAVPIEAGNGKLGVVAVEAVKHPAHLAHMALDHGTLIGRFTPRHRISSTSESRAA
jgi:hypothetical protein